MNAHNHKANLSAHEAAIKYYLKEITDKTMDIDWKQVKCDACKIAVHTAIISAVVALLYAAYRRNKLFGSLKTLSKLSSAYAVADYAGVSAEDVAKFVLEAKRSEQDVVDWVCKKLNAC